ncbi:MAG TPA: carbohydrate kinase family protein [Spirochaetales bacterium]|nr:carbohydrate kinase family protein [Spirochaetales bacterium]
MKVLVSGLVNIETTLKIPCFPLDYSPVLYPFNGVGLTVSGVGFNLALALQTLGHDVEFLTFLGNDTPGAVAMSEIAKLGVATDRILRNLPATPQSVILYDDDGRRQIHVDLKDVQDRRYPAGLFRSAVDHADAVVVCNVNFNRELLPAAARLDIPVFTDVHVLSDPRDEYNRDFMAAADVLFLSDEGLWSPPDEAARQLADLYDCRIVVIGLGAEGALLCERGQPSVWVPAAHPRPVVSTIGAGDALMASFAHGMLAGLKPAEALRRAVMFAGWKIGEAGAACGFLDAQSLDTLCRGQQAPDRGRA